MKTIATWIGLAVGAAALLLQLALSIPLRIGNGDTLLGAVIYFFTFFTILTNIMLVLIYASELWPRESLRWWRSAVTRGMMAAVMILVCLFYTSCSPPPGTRRVCSSSPTSRCIM